MKSQFTAGRIPAAAAGVQARGAQAAASRSSRVVLSCAALALGGLLVAGNARAESVTRVYQSRMPDGSVVFGDKPAQGAVQHEGRDYRLPDARRPPRWRPSAATGPNRIALSSSATPTGWPSRPPNASRPSRMPC